MQAEDALIGCLIDALSPAEKAEAVVYVMPDPLPPGTTLRFGPLLLQTHWDALLAFIDQQPHANWAHGCRYVLINRSDGEMESTPGRFPPFPPGTAQAWRIVYPPRSFRSKESLP